MAITTHPYRVTVHKSDGTPERVHRFATRRSAELFVHLLRLDGDEREMTITGPSLRQRAGIDGGSDVV